MTSTDPTALPVRTDRPTRLPEGDVVLQIDGVTKVFADRRDGEVRAVDGVDLTIRRGELVALLGPNGAGKTTTIDMVLGLTTPTTGTLSVFGERAHQAVADGRVSAVLQSGGLLQDLTVRETMQVIASTFDRPVDIDSILDRVGIAELARRRISKCSGGEQQRLRFALSLIPDPDLLVLDEPTAGMDVAARREFWDGMHAEAADGRTVIFATHYLQEAEDFAERIVLMASGRIIADGSTGEVRSTAGPRHVSFSIEEALRPAALDRLRTMSTVAEVAVDGDRIRLSTTTADDVARLVLNELGGREIEVMRGTLDDAFVMLTQAPPADSTPLSAAARAQHSEPAPEAPR